MKILFTRFPLESSYGGAEVQTISLMKGLRDRGHAVAFAGSCPTLLRLCKEEAFPAVELMIGPPPVSKWTVLSFTWRKQKMQHQLEELLKQFSDLDVLCMLSLSEKILLTPFALQKGIKTCWIEHDRVGPWLSKNPWLKNLLQMSKDVTTITVSELSRKIYVDLGWNQEKTIAIPNGIQQPSPFDKAQGKPPPASLHLGCIARLTKDKGVDVLLEAIADMPQISLTIVGKGREEGFIRNLITQITEREHLTEPRIQLISNVPDLSVVYNSIDVLILPSREHDPFGLVAGEAMLHGIPVIVTDTCGIAGYLENQKDAIVVEANSVHALQEGIQTLSDVVIRKELSEHGKRTAEQKFSLNTMIQSYEKIFQPSRS